MTKKVSIIAVAIFAALLSAGGVEAQRNTASQPECRGPVYKGNEVSRPAKVITPPDFSGVKDVFREVHASVRLEAVLCRNGRVTDVKILEGPTDQVNEFVSLALQSVEFRPAEMNWHSVSQSTQFEFEINGTDIKQIAPPPGDGPIIEAVAVIGNRRLKAADILASIGTRAGERFNEALIKSDFDKLLATGQFDKTLTRVVTEPGVRGGLNVHFEVAELPVVGEIKLEGLVTEPSTILQVLSKIGIRAGAPYTPTAGQAGVRVIKQMLAAEQNYASVELRTEFKDLQTVNLVFVISKQ